MIKVRTFRPSYTTRLCAVLFSAYLTVLERAIAKDRPSVRPSLTLVIYA